MHQNMLTMHRIQNTTTTFEATQAELQKATLHHVEMTSASLDHVKMERSTIANCGFQMSDFADCNFTGATFLSCDFTGATINGIQIEDLLAAYKSLRHPQDSGQQQI